MTEDKKVNGPHDVPGLYVGPIGGGCLRFTIRTSDHERGLTFEQRANVRPDEAAMLAVDIYKALPEAERVWVWKKVNE